MKGARDLQRGARRLLAIYRREVFTYFVSPTAYIILLVFLLVNGITFYFNLRFFSGHVGYLVAIQYSSIIFWFLVLLIPPLLTMRSFAEERRSGTWELLTTTGVGDATIVAGKFLAAWSFFLFLWLAVLPPFFFLESVADIDWGMILTVHGGLVLLGALLTSIGIFSSSFGANQLVAASVAMLLNLVVFFLHYFRFLYEPGDVELRVFQYVSPLAHFGGDFTLGVFDGRYVVLYASVAWFFLFLAVKSLERRRWW